MHVLLATCEAPGDGGERELDEELVPLEDRSDRFCLTKLNFKTWRENSNR